MALALLTISPSDIARLLRHGYATELKYVGAPSYSMILYSSIAVYSHAEEFSGWLPPT